MKYELNIFFSFILNFKKDIYFNLNLVYSTGIFEGGDMVQYRWRNL